MDSITGLRFAELNKKPSYDELIDVIIKDYTAKLPDRVATFLYNSPELSNLLAPDGTGLNDLEQHEEQKHKQEIKEIEIKRQASRGDDTANHLRAKDSAPSTFSAKTSASRLQTIRIIQCRVMTEVDRDGPGRRRQRLAHRLKRGR